MARYQAIPWPSIKHFQPKCTWYDKQRRLGKSIFDSRVHANFIMVTSLLTPPVHSVDFKKAGKVLCLVSP